MDIIVDNFGSTHLDLEYLMSLNVNGIKIDPTYLQNFSKSRDGRAVQSIIERANNLQLKVIAEGVETLEQVDFLSANHCDFLQGYYFTHPLKHKEATKLFKKAFLS